MTCFKTGARVHFESYGMTVPGDIDSVVLMQSQSFGNRGLLRQ